MAKQKLSNICILFIALFVTEIEQCSHSHSENDGHGHEHGRRANSSKYPGKCVTIQLAKKDTPT